MSSNYDICVDYDTLCVIEEKLSRIMYNLTESADRMEHAIRVSQGFLSGNQFEKAKGTTNECVALTAKTAGNIQSALNYLGELRQILDEYEKMMFEGEN